MKNFKTMAVIFFSFFLFFSKSSKAYDVGVTCGVLPLNSSLDKALCGGHIWLDNTEYQSINPAPGYYLQIKIDSSSSGISYAYDDPYNSTHISMSNESASASDVTTAYETCTNYTLQIGCYWEAGQEASVAFYAHTSFSCVVSGQPYTCTVHFDVSQMINYGLFTYYSASGSPSALADNTATTSITRD